MDSIARPFWTPKKVAIEEFDPRHLHPDQADQQLASAGASVSLDAEAAEVQLLERGKQLERKGILGPVLGDDRRDLGLHEHAHLACRTARSSAVKRSAN